MAFDQSVSSIKRWMHCRLSTKKVNFVFDADIRDFFNKINREWLVKFIEHRIADIRVVRLIQKWLNAGIWKMQA